MTYRLRVPDRTINCVNRGARITSKWHLHRRWRREEHDFENMLECIPQYTLARGHPNKICDFGLTSPPLPLRQRSRCVSQQYHFTLFSYNQPSRRYTTSKQIAQGGSNHDMERTKKTWTRIGITKCDKYLHFLFQSRLRYSIPSRSNESDYVDIACKRSSFPFRMKNNDSIATLIKYTIGKTARIDNLATAEPSVPTILIPVVRTTFGKFPRWKKFSPLQFHVTGVVIRNNSPYSVM